MKFTVKERRQTEGMYSFGGPALLLSPFAKILSGVLFVGLLGSLTFGGWQFFRNQNLEIDLLNQVAEVNRLNGEINLCRANLDTQNNKIIELTARAKEDQLEIQEMEDKLSIENKLLRAEVNYLKSQPAPENCEDSANLLRNNLNIFKDGRQ